MQPNDQGKLLSKGGWTAETRFITLVTLAFKVWTRLKTNFRLHYYSASVTELKNYYMFSVDVYPTNTDTRDLETLVIDSRRRHHLLFLFLRHFFSWYCNSDNNLNPLGTNHITEYFILTIIILRFKHFISDVTIYTKNVSVFKSHTKGGNLTCKLNF